MIAQISPTINPKISKYLPILSSELDKRTPMNILPNTRPIIPNNLPSINSSINNWNCRCQSIKRRTVLSILAYLVRQKDVEKKKNYMLWRPNSGGGGGASNKKSSRTSGRTSSSDTSDTVRAVTGAAVTSSLLGGLFGGGKSVR